MKLGLVTWNIASKWNLDTLLNVCRAAGIDGIEPRTTHPHGIEPALTGDQRKEVKKRFSDAGITLWGLGSVCEFHSPDPGELKRQIASCRDFIALARDLGAVGVKVRPNAFPDGVPSAATLTQIGTALGVCGKFAMDAGVEIWLEVHGKDTCLPDNIHKIMQACNHPSVGVCWNSNMADCDPDGTIARSFDLLRPYLKSCHITDLDNSYPWPSLFKLFKQSGYDRFTLCEYPESMDPQQGVEFLKSYRERWLKLVES